MKLLFMGSAGFAVPALEALLDSEYELLEVVTQPDKPAGRGRKLTPCPVAALARERDLPLYQPKGIKRPERIEHVRALVPDCIVVVAYGRILPAALLAIPPMGCVNVHASLLPHYRGAAPINWAIVNGETETGVTTQRIVEELDAGDILLQATTTIDETETAQQLHDRLAGMGAELLIKTLDGLAAGTITPQPQDPEQVSFAPILAKEDGHIDWSLPAQKIYDRIRGFTPWPGSFTLLGGKRLRVIEAAPLNEPTKAPPGTAIDCDTHLCVACGEGRLYLIEVQPEGKKPMSATDFLRGHRIEKGARLG